MPYRRSRHRSLVPASKIPSLPNIMENQSTYYQCSPLGTSGNSINNRADEWASVMVCLSYIRCSVMALQLIDAVGGVREAVTPADDAAYPPQPPDMSQLSISGETEKAYIAYLSVMCQVV